MPHTHYIKAPIKQLLLLPKPKSRVEIMDIFIPVDKEN